MQKDASLTYGQLHDKLKSLGFQEYRVELNGKSGRVFQHPTVSGTLIALPERKPDDLVEPFYLQQVLVTLKSRGLLPETNPLLT
jgi:hypothetical protein